MPSSMEGSSREGDLFTVKHELKNGKLAVLYLKCSSNYTSIGFIRLARYSFGRKRRLLRRHAEKADMVRK